MYIEPQHEYTDAEIEALNDVADVMSDAALRLPEASDVRGDLRMWAMRVAAALPVPGSAAPPAQARTPLRLVK